MRDIYEIRPSGNWWLVFKNPGPDESCPFMCKTREEAEAKKVEYENGKA